MDVYINWNVPKLLLCCSPFSGNLLFSLEIWEIKSPHKPVKELCFPPEPIENCFGPKPNSKAKQNWELWRILRRLTPNIKSSVQTMNWSIRVTGGKVRLFIALFPSFLFNFLSLLFPFLRFLFLFVFCSFIFFSSPAGKDNRKTRTNGTEWGNQLAWDFFPTCMLYSAGRYFS